MKVDLDGPKGTFSLALVEVHVGTLEAAGSLLWDRCHMFHMPSFSGERSWNLPVLHGAKKGKLSGAGLRTMQIHECICVTCSEHVSLPPSFFAYRLKIFITSSCTCNQYVRD